ARPLRDHFVDVGLADRHLARVVLDVELLADVLERLARLHFLVAVVLRLLEVLLGDGRLHVFDRHPDAAVDLPELLRPIARRPLPGGGRAGRGWGRAPAWSTRSLALSGRKRSVM